MAAAGLALQPAFGQGTLATPASMDVAAPPPVRITGKIVLEDKSPPPAPVLIERVCQGMGHPEGITDAKGNIAVDLGHDIIRDPYAIHIQPGVDLPPAEENRPFMDCAIRFSLPGYRTDMVSMSTATPVGHPYLGTIVLHFVGKVDGYLISPTSLDAPKDARKAFDKAQEVTRKNKQAEALQNYQKAVQIYPQYAAAWYELGRLQSAAHKVDDAKQSFNTAMKADPKYLSPYLQLSSLAESSENWPDLADVTGRLIALDPIDYPEAYFYGALSNYRTHKLDVAEKFARDGLKVDVDHHFPQTYQLLASILVARNQTAAAVEQLETYLKLFPRADDVVTVQGNLVLLRNSLHKK
ncbi:MAG: tetratricopeptide repeat protein [Bryobacteraceae bacterium]|jgi:lipopolysaccharide biosynthesis regulator YciM